LISPHSSNSLAALRREERRIGGFGWPPQRHFKVVFDPVVKVLLRHGDFFAQQKGNNEKETKTRN
jgi:hypothetical protein